MTVEPVLIALAVIGTVFAFLGFCLSVWNTIEIQASKRATHTVMPIAAGGDSMADFEKKINEITKGAGADQGDLNRGMFEAGLDPEEMV